MCCCLFFLLPEEEIRRVNTTGMREWMLEGLFFVVRDGVRENATVSVVEIRVLGRGFIGSMCVLL